MNTQSTRTSLRKSLLVTPAGMVFGVALAVTGGRAGATLIITPNYDSSVTSMSNAAQVENAVNYVCTEYEGLFNIPNRTVNVTFNVVAAAPSTGIFGESSTSSTGSNYSSIRSALIAAYAPDSADLPASDPLGGVTYAVPVVEAKALGLIANNTSTDGTFTFGAGFNYTFDPSHRAVSGEYDFIGLVEHELSEIMGRIPGMGAHGYYLPYDLFRYTGPNARGASDNGAGVYYSLDNGATDLKNYNDAAASPGSDPQDWDSTTADAYNAFASAGVEENVTPVDVTVMNSLGYASVVPEPATAALALAGFGGLLLRRRRGSRR